MRRGAPRAGAGDLSVEAVAWSETMPQRGRAEGRAQRADSRMGGGGGRAGAGDLSVGAVAWFETTDRGRSSIGATDCSHGWSDAALGVAPPWKTFILFSPQRGEGVSMPLPSSIPPSLRDGIDGKLS